MLNSTESSGIAIETCNCSTADTKIVGILKSIDESCDLRYEKTAVQRVEYEVISYREENNYFTGYSCKHMARNFKNFHYADGTIEETRTEMAIQITAFTCFMEVQQMKKNEQPDCYGKKMTRLPSSNVFWRYNEETPRDLQAWLGHRSEDQAACTLEVLTMSKECDNCPIQSKFGYINKPMNMSNPDARGMPDPGEVITFDLKALWSKSTWLYHVAQDNIILWDGLDVETKNCTKRSLEKGVGNFTNTDNKNVSRLTDFDNELDFMLTSIIPVTELCFNKNVSNYIVLGMKNIHIKIRVISASKRNTKNEVDMSGHLQFMQNSIVDQENKLLKNIQRNYCDNQRNRQSQAIVAAQYNGWLGAAILTLPYCTRLIPTANSAFIQECESKRINFTTARDRCGAKPVWNNFTISVNGKELTKNEECYWKGSIVTMGESTYALVNDNWTMLHPNYEMNVEKKIEKLRYRVDHALDHIFSKDLEADTLIVSHMYAVADLVAVINAHENDPAIGRPHISAALLNRHEVSNHSFLQTMVSR